MRPTFAFKTIILLIVTLVLPGLFVFGQGVAKPFTVEVKDSNGSAVSGAKVDLVLGGIKIKSVAANAEGVAVFDDVKPGGYKVSVEARGFASVLREAPVANGPDEKLEVILPVSGVNETVTVTATRTQVTADETAVPVSVIGREWIEEKNINSVGEIFRTLPGTSTVNEGGFQVRPRIRGLDSNRVLILVNGERLNNSRTSTAQSGVEVGLVDASEIESVEVVRGSGSVLYGTDALGGTINIITRDTPVRRDKGFHFGARLNTLFSSNEKGRRGNLSLNGSGRYFAFAVAQSMDRFENYFTGKPEGQFLSDLRAASLEGITDDGEVLNSQSHGSNSAATVRFFLNDTSTIRANYDRRRASNIGSPGLLGVFTGYFPFSNRDKVSVRYDSAALTDNLERLSVSGYYQTQFRDFTNVLTVPPFLPFFPGIFQFSETVTDTRSTGFDLQTDWKLGSRNLLTTGASFFRDNNNDRRLIISASTASSPDQSVSNTKSVPDASLTNIAAFAQDEFRLTRRLKFIGGIRLDNFRTKASPTEGFALPILRQDQIDDLGIGALASGLNVSNTAVTGDFGAVFDLNKYINLSARLGRSFRTPNIFEIFFTDSGSVGGFVVGNPGLKPETGTNFDANLRFRTKRFFGTVTYFRNSYSNFLATPAADDSRGCPIFIVQPGTVYDADNCNIVSSPPGRSPVRVFQTQNIDRARIQGFEAEFEAPFRIKLGYLTPNGNFSYLRGDDTDKNVPLDVISPFRTNVGVRWQNVGRNYFFDYTARIVAEQKRLSPEFLLPVNQGGNGGPEAGFITHNVSGGYYFRKEHFNFSVNLGVSNLSGKAYSEQFVFAPARGRSFTIGTTWEIK